jgi:hypothetical protein
MCVLALALGLAQPISTVAWFEGAHATLEQAALHEKAMEQGDLHHHGHDLETSLSRYPANAETLDARNAELGPGDPSFEPLYFVLCGSPDFLKAATIERPAVRAVGEARPVVSPQTVLERQHFPPVPQRPPI